MVGVVMPIVNPVEQAVMFHHWLSMGLQIAGGYPLYLIGGADSYSDVDLYTNRYWQLNLVAAEIGMNNIKRTTPHTLVCQYGDIIIQLVKPAKRPISDDELLLMADLSPSACLLRWNGGFEVLALYPDDIKRRICRVLDKHDWTWYRIQQYERKGYRIEYDATSTH